MASIWRRIGHALFGIPAESESERRQPEREQPPQLPEPPSKPPPRRRREHPEYNARTDSWDGISDRDWRRISTIANSQLDQVGASFNRDVELNYLAQFRTGNKATDLKAIIDALESGLITPQDMITLLRFRERAALTAVREQDTRMGNMFWHNRISGLPEELYWYQWGW